MAVRICSQARWDGVRADTSHTSTSAGSSRGGLPQVRRVTGVPAADSRSTRHSTSPARAAATEMRGLGRCGEDHSRTRTADSMIRSSRRDVAGIPSVPGLPAAMSCSHQATRPGRSVQGTSSTPGRAGPLRRRPSMRLVATDTTGVSGQCLDSSTASASVQPPGTAAANSVIAGDCCPGIPMATAAAGVAASATATSPDRPERARCSSASRVSPTQSRNGRGLSATLVSGICGMQRTLPPASHGSGNGDAGARRGECGVRATAPAIPR